MRFVALFGYGPSWQEGKNVYEQGAPIERHLEAMRRRFDEGSLLLGGPFESQGGIAILEAADLEEATRIIDSDPAIEAGVLDYRMHRLYAYFDSFGAVRADDSVAQLAAQRSGV